MKNDVSKRLSAVFLALSLFAKNRGYKWWTPLVAGCGMGLLDETVKVFLPGREFGTGDLVRDFVGGGDCSHACGVIKKISVNIDI